jgi:Zn finger protein HypA/HybF involved in hydrogenase expression
MRNERTYAYVYAGIVGERDTRHEAIGDLAKHGDWERDDVVAITENCLVDWDHAGPVHLGNRYYGDRRYLATKHGAVRIEREDLVRFVNDTRQDVVESTWYADCPICGRRVSVDGGSEAARSDLIQQVLDHCGTEWFPPSDCVEDCDICGDDHRGEFACTPPSLRTPFPGVDEDYACARCGWDGRGDELTGPDGECPNCDSTAVEVTST